MKPIYLNGRERLHTSVLSHQWFTCYMNSQTPPTYLILYKRKLLNTILCSPFLFFFLNCVCVHVCACKCVCILHTNLSHILLYLSTTPVNYSSSLQVSLQCFFLFALPWEILSFTRAICVTVSTEPSCGSLLTHQWALIRS